MIKIDIDETIVNNFYNGVKGYISSISYIQETNSISLFVEMVLYANILFAPMTQLYSSSLETVESIPSDAINLDF